MEKHRSQGQEHVGEAGTGKGSEAEPLLQFPWEGIGEAGSAGLELAGLNHFSGLWNIEPAPSFLVSGPV